MTTYTYDLIDYSPKTNSFFFRTKYPNVSVIYGIKRAASKDGGTIWYFPCSYPGGYLALKDFKNLINGRATQPAIKKIEYLKSVQDKIASVETISSLPMEYVVPPYPHQLESAEAMLHYNRLALLLEQGMGKTYTTLIYLQALKHLKQRNIKCIVLAPVIVLSNWYRETVRFSSFKPIKYYGTEDERLRLRARITDDDWDVLITNYETLVPTHFDFTKTGLTTWWLGLDEDRRLQLFTYWCSKNFLTADDAYICSIQYKVRKGETVIVKKYLDDVYSIIKKVPKTNLVSPELRQTQLSIDDLRFLKSLPCDTLTLDEGSRIKGHDTKRSLAAMQLAENIDRRYILSGTLCLGNPTDVYMPMTLLDSNIFGSNYYLFERRHAIYSKFNKHMVLKWKNLDKLKLRMDPYVIERKREDCLYLPDRIMDKRYYTLSREQLKLYNEIASLDEIEVNGKKIDVSMPVIKINKICQVLSGHLILPIPRNDEKCNGCSNVVTCVRDDIFPWQKQCLNFDPENPVHKPKKEYYALSANPKIDLLIQDLELSNEKTIVWAFYTYDIEIIKQTLIKRNIKFIMADEEDCDYKFESDDSYRVFLGQVSQGIGITLNSATTMIYYSHGLGLEARLQSMDRNLRIGQTKNVLVKDYVGEGSIEETIVSLMLHKKDVKDFIQSKAECQECHLFVQCFEAGVSPYSNDCVLKHKRIQAETKRTIKIKEMEGYVEN